MPYGEKHEAHNQKGKSPKAKKAINRLSSDINQEAKRRVVKERKTGKYDGNAGTR